MDAGTRALSVARRAARDHDLAADPAAMRRFHRISNRQKRRTKRLGLESCELQPHPSALLLDERVRRPI